MQTSAASAWLRSWRKTLGVATVFWGACLVLVILEATVGSNFVIAGLFFLSIPVLVGVLTWVNRDIVFGSAPRRFGSIVVLGVAVLVSSSLIVLVGLLAAANLKTLMTGV